jgi:hypothetical protein
MKTCRVNVSRAALLNALKRDEQNGIEQYSSALHERTPLHIRDLLSENIALRQGHLRQLERLNDLYMTPRDSA